MEKISQNFLPMVFVLIIFIVQYTNAQELFFQSLDVISAENASDISFIAEIEALEVSNAEEMNWVNSLAINLTGEILAIGRENGILSLYDLPSLDQLAEFDEHTSAVNSLDFSNVDEHTLASGSRDTTLYIWNTQSSSQPLILQSDTRSITSLSFHPEMNVIAYSKSSSTFYPANHSIVIFDLESDQEIAVLEGHETQITSIEYSSNGDLLVSGDRSGNIFFWDAISYEQITQLDAHSDLLVYDVVFNSNDTLVASIGRDGAIKVWNTRNFELIESEIQAENLPTTVSFDADSSMLAIGYTDGTLRVLDLGSFEELVGIQAHVHPIRALIFSPENDFIVTGSTDGNVRIWGVVEDE